MVEIHGMQAGDDADLANHSFDPVFLEPEGAADEANDDYDPIILPQDSPDDQCWISVEQQSDLSGPKAGNFLSAKDWDDVPEDDLLNMRVTVDKSRRFLWKRAKTEMHILRRFWKNDHPSFDNLCEHLFGEDGGLFHLFQTELDLNCQTFCRFLATFYTGSMLNVPAPRLFEIDRFRTKGLLETKEEFTGILRKMEAVDDSTRGDTLWMKLEHEFNSEMRRIFLSKREDEELTIALDDDEVHFNHTRKNVQTYGLKKHRHIKDNRFGHTLHTAGFSATGAILEAVFEREEESSANCYERVLKDLFGSRTGNGAPNLRGTTWCSDRGCWVPELLFDKILRWGGDVVGAVRRSPWHPFAHMPFDDGSADKHQRKKVPMKGFKDAFCKTADWLHSKIRATCYRVGTGTAVSLAMSTIHHGPLFDLNLAFPKDHKDYFDLTQTQEQRDEKALPCICGSFDDCCSFVKDLPIKPLTRVQGDTAWFIMRMLSLTSSTVDKMITARAGEVTSNHAERRNYEIILAAVERLNLLPHESNEPTADDSDNDSVVEAPTTGVEFHAPNWIRRVNNGEHQMFLLRVDTMDDDMIRRIVELHDHSKPAASVRKMRKDLKEWAQCDHELKRKCFWCNLSQLKDRIAEIDRNEKTTGMRKAQLLELLIAKEEEQAANNAAIAAGEDPFANSVDPVLLQLFKASFMRPLKDDEKHHCRLGHELERPFLEQLFEHSRQGKTGSYDVLAIFETPLVKSAGASVPSGALDSSDAELVCSFEGGAPESMPVEIKSRLSHTTFYSERYRMESNLGLQAFENGDEPTCVSLEADGDDFVKWIPRHKESFQLMHHVAIRDVRKGLILVGNSKKVVFGIFVTHSDRLIEAHQAVLEDLFRRALIPFCRPLDDLDLPMQKTNEVIRCEAMRKFRLTPEAFKTNFHIWRRLRLEGDVQLPIPPCNRILPQTHSLWNNVKGASDTATKLMWNCQVKFANYGKSQTVCIGRFLQLCAIAVHRQNHVARAKSDLNQCCSLVHFRNTKNRHWPFHKSVDLLSSWLIDQANERDRLDEIADENANPAVCRPVSICRTPERTERDNPRRPFVEVRKCAATCGGTPVKGRAKFPKKKTKAWEEDQRRLHNCFGNLFSFNKRSPCYLCGTNTRYFCVSCKRSVCLVNRYDKMHRLILEDDPVVDFLDGVCPPATLEIKAVAACGKETVVGVAENSCCHVLHKDSVSLSAALTMSQKPLGSIKEIGEDDS